MSLLQSAIIDLVPQSGVRTALLMLPGAKNTPRQMVEHGFVSAVRQRALPLDVMLLDAHVDYYLERSDIERLLHVTLDEVRGRGYQRIWLMGISLGGLGSMLCATRRARHIEGVLLLSPYLAISGIIAEVAAAGGLDCWQPQGEEGADQERTFLAALRHYPFHDAASPKIYLGCGRQDRFLATSQMLAARLPRERVLTLEGGHDWDTWRRLWDGLLEHNPFGLPQPIEMS